VKRHITTISFICGFIWDALTLRRIDLVYENVVFISYLSIVYVSILLLHAVETKLWTPKFLLRAKPWLPALIQFPLGGLISGFVIFYTKSASFFTSWPFIAILCVFLIGNEFLRKRYERLVFQIGVFYFTLFSYLVLVVPVVTGTINKATFYLAGVIAFVLIILLLYPVKWLFRELYGRSFTAVWVTIIGITIAFNVLYASNAIPPVPLALKEIGIYHGVVRTDTGYDVRYEPAPQYAFWRTTSGTYHRNARTNEAAYCFSSVYAPTDIRADIFHSWQKKVDDGVWARVTRVPYTIQGGREAGYRGYSIVTALSEGDWRCVVETVDRRVIGEVEFTIVDVEDSPELVSGQK